MSGSLRHSIWLVLPWSPDLPAGVSVVVSRLRKEFMMRPIEPTVIISDWFSPRLVSGADGHWRHRFAIVGEISAAGLARAAFQLPLRMWRTFKVLRDHQVGATNFHYVGLDALGVALLKRLHLYQGKLVLSFHGWDVRVPLPGLERRLWNFLLASADAITACSASLATALIATHGEICRETLVIHNGVDTQQFRPDCSANLDGTIVVPARYLVSVGSYVALKGHRTILEAFVKIAGDHPTLHLVIIGHDGPERAPLAAFAESVGLGHRVDCRTDLPPEAVASILANAVACVQPSLDESFGIAVIEAGACGIPVVASAVGGHLELLVHGETGFLFRSGDVAHCAETIQSVLIDHSSALAAAKRFRQIVLERYTWTKCADQYAAASGWPPRESSETASTTDLPNKQRRRI